MSIAAISAGATPPGVGLTPADGQCEVAWPAQHTPLVDHDHRFPEGAEAARLRRFARSLRAPGGTIEDPCLDGVDCEPALAGVFAAFDRVSATMTTQTGERAGVVIFGNSLIAADRIVNVLRRRLQEQLGDGGRGLVLADRLGPVGPRDRTAAAAEGWLPTSVADYEDHPDVQGVPHGVGGAAHVSNGPAVSRFDLVGETQATVLSWGAPRRPGLEVRVRGGTWQPVLAVDGGATVHRFMLPEGARTFELRARAKGAFVHGVALEHDRGGVVIDTLGVAAADAARFNRVPETVFSTELDARRPDLVVIMLGGNEVKRVAWSQRTVPLVREHLSAMITRVAPSPTRSCLVVGPIDAVVGDRDRKPEQDVMTQRPELEAVNEAHRSVAFAHGCAFFDLYAAMGSKGSLARLQEANALFSDLVHPNDRGLAMLGQLLSDAVLQAWRTTPSDGRPFSRRPPPPSCGLTTSLGDERRADSEARAAPPSEL